MAVIITRGTPPALKCLSNANRTIAECSGKSFVRSFLLPQFRDHEQTPVPRCDERATAWQPRPRRYQSAGEHAKYYGEARTLEIGEKIVWRNCEFVPTGSSSATWKYTQGSSTGAIHKGIPGLKSAGQLLRCDWGDSGCPRAPQQFPRAIPEGSADLISGFLVVRRHPRGE